jgi:hypothetical protein
VYQDVSHYNMPLDKMHKHLQDSSTFLLAFILSGSVCCGSIYIYIYIYIYIHFNMPTMNSVSGNKYCLSDGPLSGCMGGPTGWAYGLGLWVGPTGWAYGLGLRVGPTGWAYRLGLWVGPMGWA